jgi:L-seryl-tRNA(Ser) seleniumtransferase
MSSSQENRTFTRRNFLRWSQSALASLGLAPIVGVGTAAKTFALPNSSASVDDYYAKLGVEKIINAAGTYTYLTAALMPPQVQRAVAQAALHPVRLKDLQQASGEYIATNFTAKEL